MGSGEEEFPGFSLLQTKKVLSSVESTHRAEFNIA